MHEPLRILGRQHELLRRPRRDGELRLDDEVRRWSRAANLAWLERSVGRDAVFRQVSEAPPGTMLRWELDRLQALGYVAVGPFWAPGDWLRRRATYRRVVRLVARHVTAQRADDDAHYEPKCRAELEPLLDLWPHVLLVPTRRALGIDDLIRLRAVPVHPLGIADEARWADGDRRSPSEFFFHDLDHARFKVREDLLLRGVSVPDAYAHGSTFDPATGRHRTFVATAARHVDGHGWREAARRRALAHHLLAAAARSDDRTLGSAARWLLFEMVHEKSLPLEAHVLSLALASRSHEQKLRAKHERGFFGSVGPTPGALHRLDDARRWLLWLLAETRA